MNLLPAHHHSTRDNIYSIATVMATNLHEEWVRRLHQEDVREELRIAAEIEVCPVGGAGNVCVRELGREILTGQDHMGCQSAPG